jgi:hypothetical protein
LQHRINISYLPEIHFSLEGVCHFDFRPDRSLNFFNAHFRGGCSSRFEPKRFRPLSKESQRVICCFLKDRGCNAKRKKPVLIDEPAIFWQPVICNVVFEESSFC